MSSGGSDWAWTPGIDLTRREQVANTGPGGFTVPCEPDPAEWGEEEPGMDTWDEVVERFWQLAERVRRLHEDLQAFGKSLPGYTPTPEEDEARRSEPPQAP